MPGGRMSRWGREQAETLEEIRRWLSGAGRGQVERFREQAAPYLAFRARLDEFLSVFFAGVCTRSCYENSRSACCSRDGIIVFFADLLINALCSAPEELQRLSDALRRTGAGDRCSYLGKGGCMWRVRPVVCAMFLCGRAEKEVFGRDPAARRQWEGIVECRKSFTWPDRPVLFDRLEAEFIAMGLDSPLMYCHKSPGLLRVKKKAGL